MKFSADYFKRELEAILRSAPVPGAAVDVSSTETEMFGADAKPGVRDARPPEAKRGRNLFSDLIIAGPAPAPLPRAEKFYRYQIMLRTRAMSGLSRELARLIQGLALPEEVSLAVDVDPVSLS